MQLRRCHLEGLVRVGVDPPLVGVGRCDGRVALLRLDAVGAFCFRVWLLGGGGGCCSLLLLLLLQQQLRWLLRCGCYAAAALLKLLRLLRGYCYTAYYFLRLAREHLADVGV